jgi:hypothetical protein
MINVNFKYDLNEVVTTPLNDKGIILMAAVDRGGIIYYVSTKLNSEWFQEKLLTPTKTNEDQPK